MHMDLNKKLQLVALIKLKDDLSLLEMMERAKFGTLVMDNVLLSC